MEDKYGWPNTDILIAKEEIIVLRTLYLEFGNDAAKKARLDLPYENIIIDDSEGYHAIDLYNMLLYYFQMQSKFAKPIELEFLGIYHYVSDVFALLIGIPWQSSVFNFVGTLCLNEIKEKLSFRFNMNIAWLKGLSDDLSLPLDPKVKKCLEKPEKVRYLEALEDYKTLSENKFFNNLRIGLWYKKYGDFDKALEYLNLSRAICLTELFIFNLLHLDYVFEFNQKMELFEKEINIDVMDAFQGPDDYHDWWITKSKMLKVPIELQLSAEETASFQIGEIYLKKGEKYLKEKEYGKSKKYYNIAKHCFHEVENYLSLWERRDRHLKNDKQKYYNELRKLYFEKLEFTDSQMKILFEATLKNPIYLPLNIRPFQKNPYLEKNLQICKNALEVIKYKQSVKMDKVKKHKEPLIGSMGDIASPNNIKNLIMEGIHKKELINNHIKISNRESIENKCQKRFPKVYPQLSWESKNEMVKDVIYENILSSLKMFDYIPSIGCLARLLEKEAEITIKTIIKKHKLNFHFKHNDYKIGKLKSLLESFGQNELNIDKEEVESVIRDLIQASDFRAPFAHPARGGTHEELKEFRKLLFGRNKEEDGLIFKIIKYRKTC